ncbi:MAG: CPBP family intramembrane metalloprotease [Saprospiraceae bacterium]|nr:CPBP family intramembrane metalloprotease [Saprospiraceae bacterium]
MNPHRRIPSNYFYFAFPVLIISFNCLLSRALLLVYKDWTWIVLTLVYWSTLWFGIWFLKNKIGVDYRSWWSLKNGFDLWAILSIFAGFLTLPILLKNASVLGDLHWTLIAIWLLFSVINPFFEESFWRGFLIAYPIQLKAVYKIGLSVIFFCLSRMLIFGIISSNVSDPLLMALFFSATIWGITFHTGRNIFFTYLGHVVLDITLMMTYLWMDDIQL